MKKMSLILALTLSATTATATSIPSDWVNPVEEVFDVSYLMDAVTEYSPVYTKIFADKEGQPRLDASDIAVPTIVRLTDRELQERWPEATRITGLYDSESKTIYIRDSLDLDTVYGQSIMLHELVHHVQYELGVDAYAECETRLEEAAYKIQIDYLKANDYDNTKVLQDLGFFKVFMANCRTNKLG